MVSVVLRIRSTRQGDVDAKQSLPHRSDNAVTSGPNREAEKAVTFGQILRRDQEPRPCDGFANAMGMYLRTAAQWHAPARVTPHPVKWSKSSFMSFLFSPGH